MRVFARISMAIAAAGLLVAAGCGDDGGNNNPDARPLPDAMNPADAGPDAMPAAEFSGQVSVLDLRVNGIPQLGHGGQVLADYRQIIDETATKIYDDRSPLGAGCAAWVYDFAQGQFPSPNTDHGTISITGTTATIPPCTFVNGDYACVAGVGALAATDTITNNGNGTTNVLIQAGTFSDANVGMYLKLSGAADYANNGAFPIIAVSGGGTVLVVINQDAVSVTAGNATGVQYAIVAGVGPVPPAIGPSPEFLADADTATVALTPPTGDAVEAYSTPVEAGDDFSLTPASQATISTLPLNGSTATLECDSDVASATGTFAISNSATTDDVVLTDPTGTPFANVRPGAEVTVSGAAMSGNNGTFTITAAGDTTITYTNPNQQGTVDTVTDYAIDDCGTALVSVVSINFSNAPLKAVVVTESAAGAFTDEGGGTCRITNAGKFMNGMDGLTVTVSGSTTAGNDGTFAITASTTDYVEYDNANCTAEDLAGSYTVMRDLKPYETPEPALGTKAGVIFCAALSSGTISIPADAMAAIPAVDPNRVRTTFIRGGLGKESNADNSNPTNIVVGHAIVGFTNK